MKFRKGDIVTARFRVKYDVSDEDATVFMGHADNEYRDLNLPVEAVTLVAHHFEVGSIARYGNDEFEVVANVKGQLLLKAVAPVERNPYFITRKAEECSLPLTVDEMRFIANPPKSFLPPSPMFPPKPEPDAPTFAAGDIPMMPLSDREDRSGE